MTTPTKPLRMIYVDDSGAVETGYVVYSWVETTHEDWKDVLSIWLNFRKSLYADFKIPPATELHATKLASHGRGRPSTDPTVNKSPELRRTIMQQALQAIGSMPQVRLGTVYRATTAKGPAYAIERYDLYGKLVSHLDDRLAAADEKGLIFMDGSSTEPGYHAAHRRLKLQDRSIIEDPQFQSSQQSQLIQMADLTAWTGYQAVQKHPNRAFAWNWYDTYLKTADPNGGPTAY